MKPWMATLVAAALLQSFSAQATELSGKWNASPVRVSWAIGDWGPGCGPRPSGGGQSGGQVTLEDQGDDFVLRGLGRTYRSARCWERMPRLAPRSHSASSTTIRTVCTMPKGDPRQARVVTTWHIRDDAIYFDETGQYQFVVKGNNCTASVRRTRVLKRVVPPKTKKKPQPQPPRGAPQPEATRPAADESTPPAAEPPPEPKRTSRCDDPSKPVRIEVTPKSKLMRPGEEFSFTAVARDRHGCRVKLHPQWTLTENEDLAELADDGTLTVAERAESGVVRLAAKVGEHQVEVSARVVSNEEYERLLDRGSYGAMGESRGTASLNLLSSEVAVGPAETGNEEDDEGKTLLIWVAIATAFVVALGVVILWKRGHSEQKDGPGPLSVPPSTPDEADEWAAPEARSSSTEAASPPGEPSAVSSEQDQGPSAPAGPKARVCPICGRRYPPDTAFCGDDGARLVPGNE